MRAPFTDPLLGLELLNKALPLVGRDMEMQIARSLLDNIARTQPAGAHALIISGEVGTGKSRLLEELCMASVDLGFTVLMGIAYESGSMFPYLPFIEALRPVIRSSSKEDLRRYVGLDPSQNAGSPDSTPEIASLTGLPLVTAFCQLFPEVSQKLQVTLAQEFLSPDQEKFRLFDAIATLLEKMAQERPILFCIDNLQWADSASLELTMYLTVRLHGSRVALVGATRPPQVMPDPAGDSDDTSLVTPASTTRVQKILYELMHQGLLLLLPLGSLNETASEEHIHNLLPGVLPETLTQSLLERAGGNPFFLEELVRTLCLNEQLVLHDGVWRMTTPVYTKELPDRITLAVRQRLRGLACREMLQVASLFGRTFPLQALGQVCGLSEASAQALIEEALQATLVTRVCQFRRLG